MAFCCRLLKFRTKGTRRLVRIFVFLVIASFFLSILTDRMKGAVSDPVEPNESISRSFRTSHFNLAVSTTPSNSSTTDAASQRESSTTEVPSQQESGSGTNAPMRYKLAVGIAVAKRNPPTIYRLLEEIFQAENDLHDVVVVVHVAYDASKDQELLQALHRLRGRLHVDIQKEPHPQADPKNIPSTRGDMMERTIWRTTEGTV